MTDTLILKLENCYGIGKLDTTIEFKHKGFAIYAPNGVMKTSFAKTFIDLSNDETPNDKVFPHRESSFNVTLNGNDIPSDEIFVVKSYDGDYFSNKVSTLLANSNLRARYETVHKEIAVAKKDLDNRLRNLSGYGEKSREKIEPIIEEVFDGEYYEALLNIHNEVSNTSETTFCNANYKILFDPKVVKFLEEETIKEAVSDFTRKYEELTSQSPILRKDFQYHNVNQVQQLLKTNKYFEAGHRIVLVDEKGELKSEHATNEEFVNEIEEEKKRVINDDKLRSKFDKFNSKLKNKELQLFRDYITENQEILPELQDLNTFKRKLWIQYLSQAHPELDLLVSKYKNGQRELNTIISEANTSIGEWDSVIEDFNRRFLHLPFELIIENKSDVILKSKAPSISFKFSDSSDQRTYQNSEKKDLLHVLSTGEARALYILNIMFEIHMRWKDRKKTLLIFDDISDSFDYKNKFAIIDYLEYVIRRAEVNFLSIILTHNFDFLRTIASRQICPPHQCCLATKNNDEITLLKFDQSHISSPFQKWRSQLDDPIIQIAFVPFLRNVVEYTQGKKNSDDTPNADYLNLTNMLHYKQNTSTLTFADYKSVFERTFPNNTFPSIDLTTNILDQIFASAERCLTEGDGINLQHKIVLAIAARLSAERYIITKIKLDDPDFETSKKQTGELVQAFEDRYNNLTDPISILRRVALITPSNIHINAFMYEPILDMGMNELKTLYTDVIGLV